MHGLEAIIFLYSYAALNVRDKTIREGVRQAYIEARMFKTHTKTKAKHKTVLTKQK